ncbi:hypothetical protein ACQKWADRAFT_96046 [Trichoderma austrokoningii]
MECDGATLRITRNCMGVAPAKKHGRSHFVDRWSLHRSNVRSRTQRPGRTHARHLHASCWLGKQDEASKTAIRYLGDITLMSVDKGLMERYLPLLAGLQVKTDSDDPIGPLFKRSWFSRMWTIQVTLPLQHQVHVIICVFGHCTRYAESIGLPVVRVALCFAVTGASEQTLVREERRECQQAEYGTQKKCTDPKDRVFALFGISQELDITRNL